jgi:hypothetical protein
MLSVLNEVYKGIFPRFKVPSNMSELSIAVNTWKHSEVAHYDQKRSLQIFNLFDRTGNPASDLGVSGII